MSDRRTTHGMRSLMVRMASERLTRRQQRALGRIQHGLTADTLPNLHALTIGHLSRLELLWQGYQAHAIAHPNEPFPPHAVAIGNAWRRMAETLLTIEQQLVSDRDTPSLSDYLAARAQPAPPVAATAARPADDEEPAA